MSEEEPIMGFYQCLEEEDLAGLLVEPTEVPNAFYLGDSYKGGKIYYFEKTAVILNKNKSVFCGFENDIKNAKSKLEEKLNIKLEEIKNAKS